MKKNTFRHPANALRAKTFWSLNGALEEDELKKQIRRLKRMGFGGAYLHARTGLKTEYLGEEWMRLMNVCAEELASCGMQAWLYDEDRYPSGVAGGLVTKDPTLRGKYLTVRVVDLRDYRHEPYDIAAFSVEFEGEKLVRYCPYRDGDAEKVAVFSVRILEDRDVYNGFAYADLLKKKTTEEFIRITHSQYLRAMGKKFGRSVKGIFTDEPNRGAVFNGFAHVGDAVEARVPYTDDLFEAYHAQWGEHLEEVLPELYFRGEDAFSRTAWRYVETLTKLFLENYAKPYADWCENHKLEFTGHILHEDNLTAMTTLCGSPMRFYEYMTVPGVDNLTAGNTNVAVPAMAASVARQLGKRGVLSEMYAAIGWQADFATYKRIGDWHAFFGVSERCTHLSMYTMAGGAKRDFPASLLQQAVWWRDYPLVEDYFARLTYFLTEGKRSSDVLVIHPVESAWGMSRMGGYRNFFTPVDEPYLDLEKTYWNVVNRLAEGGVRFDFGDEEMMSRLATVDTRGTPRVRLGYEYYPAVLLPGNITLRESTVRILEFFLRAGGRVYAVGGLPDRVEGDLCDLSARLGGVEIVSEEQLLEKFPLPYRVEGGKSYVSFTEKDDLRYFAIINAGTKTHEYTITFEGEYAPELWDARTGETAPYYATYENGSTAIRKTLTPDEELLLVLRPGKTQEAAPMSVTGAPISLPDEVSYTLAEPNVLVLDFAEYSCDHARGYDEILRVDKQLREALGLSDRNPEAIQPWFREKYMPDSKVAERVRLRFRFNVETVPSSMTFLWENIAGATVSLNGKKLMRSAARHIKRDRCFTASPLPISAVTVGENVLEIVFTMREDTDIEAAYLLGDFGVRVEGHTSTVVTLPKTLRLGDIVPQGLPFYSGEIIYRFPLEAGNYEVTMSAFGGALAHVNGVPFAFPPFRASVVSEGELAVSVTITQKNTFGPLHFPSTDCVGSYAEFCPPDDVFSADYFFFPQGLYEAPVVKKEQK